MAYNTQEERLVVKGSERITRDLQVNQDVYANGNVVSDGLAVNNGVIENGTVNTLGVNSLTSAEATVTDLNVTNLTANAAVVDELTVNVNLIANGLAGNDGQVLGKVDGKVEWFSPATIDTNDFKVNYLTVNNVANIADANVANFVVDNAAINIGTANDLNVVNLAVNASANINGNNFTHKGFDVTSMTVIPEDDYNNLGATARNQAFYLTSPNGNLYLYGVKFAATDLQALGYKAYVNLPKMANNMRTLTTPTLTFSTDTITNTFVNGGAYNGIQVETSLGLRWNNSAPVGVQANDGNIITNANELYIINATNMFYNCKNMVDCFISNHSLIINAPNVDYDPMSYCENMSHLFDGCVNFSQPVIIPNSAINVSGMFRLCNNFNHPVTIPSNVVDTSYLFMNCCNYNQPITIPNNVTSISRMFCNCIKFNQPITIPNSVTKMGGVFAGCFNFNQPITIPENVTDLSEAFAVCFNFNQPITIPNSVTAMAGMLSSCYDFNYPINIPIGVNSIGWLFYRCNSFNQPVTIPGSVTNMVDAFNGCSNFNQPITIPENVTNLKTTFSNCTKLASSTVPIHISHKITLGDTSNYIYRSLVEGECGINFWSRRILNDA